MSMLSRLDAVYLFIKGLKLNKKANKSVLHSNAVEQCTNQVEIHTSFAEAETNGFPSPHWVGEQTPF